MESVADKIFEDIVFIVCQLMFGDKITDVTDTNLRVIRLALSQLNLKSVIEENLKSK